jgi:mono/diheme cytochrome c family protein
MKKSLAIFSVCGFMVSVLYAGVGAQAPASVNGGVYSAAQAARGAAIYKDSCAACHGEDLKGSGPMPALAGAEFAGNWKNLGDLFEKVQTTMPATAPGSLTPAQTSDVLAYLLSIGKYPAGAADLPSTKEALTAITMQAPAAGAAAGGAAPAGAATPATGAAAGAAAGSVKAGVYTAAQAMRGAALYK